MLLPSDLYDVSALKRALKTLGDYVYGYYRPRESEPFYVGKGQGDRILSHWTAAGSGSIKYKQYQAIRDALDGNQVPIAKVLAYDLRNTEAKDVYGLVERVLQDTFGIESHINNDVYRARVKHTPTLVQDRNDSRNFPVLSLEAVYCKGLFGSASILTPQQISESCGLPLLLVGLSKSYHPNYSQFDLREMARMYWVLDRLTAFAELRDSSSALLAGWVSRFGGPQIVGVWKIKCGSFVLHGDGSSNRYSCEVDDDFDMRKALLGVRLKGDGHSYQGPRISLPRETAS